MTQSVFATGARALRGPQASLPRAQRVAGIAAALGLHAVALGILLSYAPARTALVNAVPLMVSIITPAAPVAPPAPQTPSQSQPVKAVSPPPRASTPPPVLAAKADAPATDSAPPPPVAVPAPTMAAEPVPPAVAAAPAAPVAAPPVPVVPPSFNAAYLNNPPPAYPRLARRQGHHGTVVLRVFVGSGGSAESVQIRSSCGYEELDQAALEAVRRWRFVPARQGDQPIAAWVLVPITFTLES